MAISRSFGGQTLLKPGAYSVSRVDNAQGIAVGENNTLMLIGEASDGSSRFRRKLSKYLLTSKDLVDYYGSGDIVDAALAAGRPSITPGISAPTNFIIYKTNPSIAAIHTITVGADITTGGVLTVVVTFPINASGETFTETIDITLPAELLASAATSIVNALNANGNFFAVFEASSAAGVVSITAKKTRTSIWSYGF